MKVDDIRKILVVGMGTMGQKIALQCARCGYEVVAYDAFSKSLENARVQIPALAAELVAQQKMTPEDAEAALSRIRYTSRPEDGADADLLSESVLEDPDLKAKVFAQFHQICQPKTVFTTNTSTLLPSMWAEATGRPAQFAALHFLDVFEAQPGRRHAAPGDLSGNRGAPGGFRETNQTGTADFQERVPRLRVERHLRRHELSGAQNRPVRKKSCPWRTWTGRS